MPKVPTLYSALTTGSAASDPIVYGTDTNPFVLKKGEVVDIILNNDDAGKHPFHLHGHNFQVLARPDENAGHHDPKNHTGYPTVPMRRDTVIVYPSSNFVIRFKADNPGKFPLQIESLNLNIDRFRYMAFPLSYRMAHGQWPRRNYDRSPARSPKNPFRSRGPFPSL